MIAGALSCKAVRLAQHPSSDLLRVAARAAAQCPKCGNGEAYYNEVQTRSADEPATLFFRCVKCHHNWKEG